LTAVAADFDNDGWPDIYVACDSTPSLLFQNKRDGSFVEQAMERGVALSDDGMEQAGMGVAVGDIRLDGNLDILKTHFASDRAALYVNNGRGDFRDDALRSGLGPETRFVSWGAGIAVRTSSGWAAASIRNGQTSRRSPTKPPGSSSGISGTADLRS
jgi:hypothetical protein